MMSSITPIRLSCVTPELLMDGADSGAAAWALGYGYKDGKNSLDDNRWTDQETRKETSSKNLI